LKRVRDGPYLASSKSHETWVSGSHPADGPRKRSALGQGTSDAVVRRLRDVRGLTQLVGDAPSFAKIIAGLPNIACSQGTVLISGETGTGKELVARAIHYLSDRAPFPFVPLNCGLVGDALLEDELFGHERGAFTDAHERRQGLLLESDRGTLLLDEVDTLSARAQVALLRVLQDQTFRALGSSREQRANVRFVAATNANLRQLVGEGKFRPDLFYRLCLFSIELPPLRERKGDVPDLAAHFLARHSDRSGGPKRLSDAALAALVQFDWPGNVRELENAIVRAVHICQTDEIQAEDLQLCSEPATSPEAGEALSSFAVLKRRAIDAFERDYLIGLMQAHGGNITHAACAAGKERRDFRRLLERHGLDPVGFSPPGRRRHRDRGGEPPSNGS